MGLCSIRKQSVNRGAGILLAVAAFAMAPAMAAHAEGTLRVCLDESSPYVHHEGKDSGGFDVEVAQAVAKRLGRTLEVQWFETEVDNDNSPVTQQNALLSDGRCQLIGGYTLVRDALGKPGVPTARPPSYEGMKPGDRRRYVALGTLVPGRAYHFAPITVLLGPKAADRKIGGIADLQGLKLGSEQMTVADTVLMNYGDGKYVDQITHVIPGRNELLPRLDQGEYDAVMVPLSRFDKYRAEHPTTKIRPSGYYHRIGFNMGFVALSTEQQLLDQVNAAVGDMLASNEFAKLAQATGITFVPPRQPEILEPVPIAEFYRD
jgi:ABC-type amino acid transport substrate-binding protein